MSATVVGRISAEDLARWRQICARRSAYQVSPTAFSATEIEQTEMALIRLMSEIVECYGLDDSRAWHVSQYTGMIFYGEPE